MIAGGGARSGAAALLAAASCAALLLLWLQATRSDDASFFAREAPAEWIVYPQAPSLGARGRIELTAVFSREFELREKPERAQLRVRMHRGGVLSLNGARVELGAADGAWKQARGGDVAALLRPGRNLLVARVAA
jgi:hypothetical protein